MKLGGRGGGEVGQRKYSPGLEAVAAESRDEELEDETPGEDLDVLLVEDEGVVDGV